jgi:hypothetical protein
MGGRTRTAAVHFFFSDVFFSTIRSYYLCTQFWDRHQSVRYSQIFFFHDQDNDGQRTLLGNLGWLHRNLTLLRKKEKKKGRYNMGVIVMTHFYFLERRTCTVRIIIHGLVTRGRPVWVRRGVASSQDVLVGGGRIPNTPFAYRCILKRTRKRD